MRIIRMFIDSGHQTQEVYRFASMRRSRGVFAVKGQSQDGKPVAGPPSKSKRGEVKPVPIGTIAAKDVIYGRLKIADPGPGFIHFANHLPDEYFKQLASEQVFTKYQHGVPKRYYKQVRERNEGLDCFVYAYAAFVSRKVPLDALAKKRDRRLAMVDAGLPPQQSTGRRVRSRGLRT